MKVIDLVICFGCVCFYTIFMCLRVLGCFSIIVCFRFILGILRELMP